MLSLTIPERELYDEANDRFVYTKETTIQLEHSLVSLAKWEAKWKKPFLQQDGLTGEELKDYIRCMTITKNVDPMIYDVLTNENYEAIRSYIDDSMTATWFREDKNAKRSRKVVTAELIYYWMVALQIPIEFQKWHLNRLITLIRVCNEKNKPPKKMSKRDGARQQHALNAARRSRLHSKG